MNAFLKGLTIIAAVSLPGIASAQLTDTAYCKALSESYDKYVTNTLAGRNMEGPPVDVRKAIADCQAGNTAAAIPVLEHKLLDAKIDLPSRVAAEPTKKAPAKCGPAVWSTDTMAYVVTPCDDAQAVPPATR